MKILRLFVLISLSIPMLSFGAGDYFSPSSIGSSARMIRLGNIEGFSQASDAVFENPAALYSAGTFSGAAFTTTFMDEVRYINGSFSLGLPYGHIGFGYMNLGVTGIPLTTKTIFDADYPSDYIFEQIGEFSYTNSVIKAALQLSQTDSLHIGVSGSYYMTSLHNINGSGFNFDIGMIIDSDPLLLSIALKNIVSALGVTYTNNQVEALPLTSVYAIKYTMEDFDFLAQLRIIGSNKKFVKSFGVNFNPSVLPIFNVSAGYKEFLVLRDINYNFTIGIGLELFGLSSDYAFELISDHAQFNQKHYVSMAIKF